MDTPLFDGELVHARRMIYTPSAFAKSNLVHLQEVGQLQARSPHASTRQGLASYLFFVVESGSGTLEYEGETRVLSAGDCVFLDCRRPYRHYTGDDLWQLRWAHFYGPNMAAIYKKYRERGGQPSFHPENTAPYTRRLEALYTLAASDNYVRDMQICEGLFALLTLLMQESWHPEIVRTAGTKRQNVQEIKDYLDLHFAEKITLDALAELLAGAEAESVLPLAAVSQPASRQRASAAQSSSETNRFWIMADSSFYQCPAGRRGSILGLTSSILFSPAVVNRRSWDEFQLRLTFKAEAVIIGTERESNKNPTDIKPRSIV